MRVLTAFIAAAWVVVACRGRETIEPLEALEAPREHIDEPVPDLPTVEYTESTEVVERRDPRSSTSIEITTSPDPRAWSGPATLEPRACCRTCRSGRACGDTCIAATRECHASPGCACDG